MMCTLVATVFDIPQTFKSGPRMFSFEAEEEIIGPTMKT